MNLWNNFVFFISSLGAFNGLLIGIYFIFFTAKKNLSTCFLGLLLIALSIRIGKSVAYFFDYNVPKSLLQVGLTACLFIGPFLYFFVKTEMKQVRRLPVSWSAQIMIWALLILATGLLFPYQTYPLLWTNALIPAIYLQWGVYIGLSLVAIQPLFKKITSKEKLKPYEKWVLAHCVTVTSIFIAYVWAFSGLTKGSYLTGAIYFSLVTYLAIFILLSRRKANDLSSLNGLKYGGRQLDENAAGLVIRRLEKAMVEQELFKNKQLKVGDLARAINVSSHELSRILNESIQKNFTLFVNEYRVHAACTMLLNQPNFTIEAIGEEVGFNSKSTFFAAFKKVKGLTPNAYLQQMTPVS